MKNTTDSLAELKTMGGMPGAPIVFMAAYQASLWDARKIGDEIHLSRTCTGCWSERYSGMWNSRPHHVEHVVTIQELDAYAARTQRIRNSCEDEIADQRDSKAFHIL
jgi:hypothetical protein